MILFPKRPMPVGVWYITVFHVGHRQFGVSYKTLRGRDLSYYLYVFNLSAFKISKGRKRDLCRGQLRLPKSNLDVKLPPKRTLGRLSLIWLSWLSTFEEQEYHAAFTASLCTETFTVCLGTKWHT